MKLFASYARVDKPYCVDIVSILSVHDVWYDQRMYAGQNWWNEILGRLDWCEGFLYLLSKDSVASEYCNKEYELAKSLGRAIIPILIQKDTVLPESLREVQYVDFTEGMTPQAVSDLLNAIYVSDQRLRENPPPPVTIQSTDIRPPSVDGARVMANAVNAMENGRFDDAVFLLRQARSNGFKPQFINIDTILKEAEEALEKQTYIRVAEREYRPIAELAKSQKTLKFACEAYAAFKEVYPDYDPDDVARLCKESSTQVRKLSEPTTNFTLPLLEWCKVPLGVVTILENEEEENSQARTIYVDEFRMTKYPITNGQYQFFIDSEDGYCNPEWWQFSSFARTWRAKHPQPQPSSFKGNERPREMVSWYDAMAFCRWLSAKTGMNLTLPTQAQWQRAAQGDDNRQYPWGNTFDKDNANTRESQIRMSTIVMRYPQGASPYGVMDLAGNLWEWCLNSRGEHHSPVDITNNKKRAVQGGSFVSDYQRSQISFHYYLNPQTFYGSIGFRVVHIS